MALLQISSLAIYYSQQFGWPCSAPGPLPLGQQPRGSLRGEDAEEGGYQPLLHGHSSVRSRDREVGDNREPGDKGSRVE